MIKKLKKFFSFFTTLALLFNIFAPSLALVKQVSADTGAIWTTKNDCGAESQDVNHFNQGEGVFVNGSGFAPGDYSWKIEGKPGGASGDPNVIVASGVETVGDSGSFCIDNPNPAYTVALDDWGEYHVDFGGKGDNYRVPRADDPGSITVCKVILDPVDNIVDGSERPGSEFSIAWDGSDASIGPSVFTTALTLNTSLFGDSADGECTTYDQLPIGNYYYGEEAYPGAGWEIPLYNDFFDPQATGLGDFTPYFDREDPNRNMNSDGHVVLTAGRPHRTLAILNQYQRIPDPTQIIVHKVTYPQDDGQTPFGVTLYDPSGVIVGEEQTIIVGSPATFVVEPGTYFANETTLPDRWDGNDADCQGVKVEAEETKECTIYNTKLGSLQGRKYNDFDGDGEMDWGDEDWLNDWTIRLYDTDWLPIAGGERATGHTGLAGQYQYNNLGMGAYYACEVLESGWRQTTPSVDLLSVNDQGGLTGGLGVANGSGAGDEGPVCWGVEIEPDTNATWLLIGNQELGSIYGYKYEDGDGDLSTTADQEPLEWWIMELWEKVGGNFQDTTQRVATGVNGKYTFIELLMGTYQIREQLQGGWTNMTPLESVEIPLAPGGNEGPYDFVNFNYGYISGHKYEDLNGDGVWDNGEPAIQGWKIYAEYPDGSIHHRTTSGNTGYYSFPDLGPGEYRVYEDMSEHPEWLQTSSPQEYIIDMTSNAEELDNPDYDFGNKRNPVKIKGYKVVCDSEDLLPNWGNHGSTIDENTAQNYVNSHPECSLVRGWQFQWSGAGGGSFGAFQTDTSLLGGSWNTFSPRVEVEIFDISNLGGRIEAREVFPNNDYVPFSNAGDVSAEFYCSGDVYNYDNWEWISNLRYGQTYHCVGFNALNKGTITINKNVDENGDGDLNDKEDVLGATDWTWDIGGSGDYPTGSTQEVIPGTYLVEEDQKPGYHVTGFSCQGTDRQFGVSENQRITVDPGEDVVCTYTNTRDTGSIYGKKWNDLNGNGEWDEGEGTLGDWTIELYEDNDGEKGSLVASTQTVNTGQTLGLYSFTGIPTGKYLLCEVNQQGWDQTFPNGCHEVTLEGNDDVERLLNFGNWERLLGISIEKSNDKSGGASNGETVNYTLVVTNNGNRPLNNLEVFDALPGGFTYIPGTTLVEGVLSGDPTEVDGKLVWTLLWLLSGDSVTIEYQVEIGNEVADGIYTNLASCKARHGGEILTDELPTRFFSILFGEGEEVECDVVRSNVPIGSGLDFSASVEGQVLGAATELPAAGSETELLLGFLALMGLGIGLKIAGRKYEN